MFISERSKRIVVTMVFGSILFYTSRIMFKFMFSTFEASDGLHTFTTQAMRVLDIIGALALIVLSFLFLLSLFDIGNTVKESPKRKNQVSESNHINLKKNRLEKIAIQDAVSKNKVHGKQYHSIRDNNDLFDNILESSTFISTYSDDSRGSSCTRNNDSVSNWDSDASSGGDYGSCD
ncbi:hypothetical protein COL24_05405 [Bacillus toyonensis]|uniref:hypothetical protein n=1 Tax=Bacillus toyonensis TaxID=155322 RepID=UPI000BF95F31|nr:hypothetical protein [Bacillus toyonensis]PFX43699.1 hypothetical protein COL24_05405 [Bacillus toyonensis]